LMFWGRVHRKKDVPRMVFTFPLETIALLMINLGQWRTSKKFRDIIIRLAVEFRAALLMKGVRVTDVQVDVPAAMYNEHQRATPRRGVRPGDSLTGLGRECA
jgi:hypothetical protein